MKTNNASFLKICLVTVLFTLITGSLARAQDIIVRTNGEEIKAKVEQVLDIEIRYHRSDNLNGPVYSIKKADVFMIKYENGTKDVFTSPAVTTVPQVQSTQPLRSKVSDSDIQPAKTGAFINYSIVVPIMVFGVLSATSDETGPAIGYGAVATVFAGVGIPVGSLVSGKTRRIAGVEGSSGLRIAGWVGYGLTIADALTMLSLAQQVDFSGGPTISVALLGALSSVFMAIDGSQTATQAKSLASAATLHPIVGCYRDVTGNKFRTVGLRLNF